MAVSVCASRALAAAIVVLMLLWAAAVEVVESSVCEWRCPAEDAGPWGRVQRLDFRGLELPRLWQALREQTSQLQKGVKACPVGNMILQLWSLLAQARSLPAAAERMPLLQAARAQLTSGCASLEMLIDGSRPELAMEPWAAAVLGTLRRLAAEFRVAPDADLPLRPCKDAVRYHGRGSEDIFRHVWATDPAAVLPVHRVAAYVQLAHNRCRLGMATVLAVLSRSIRQLAMRAGAVDETLIADTDVPGSSGVLRSSSKDAQEFGAWSRWEVAALTGLAAIYLRGVDPAQVVASDWSALVDLVHDLRLRPSSRSALLAESPPPHGGAPFLPFEWRYGKDDQVPVDPPWDPSGACVAAWRKAPALVVLAEALAFPGVTQSSAVPTTMQEDLVRAAVVATGGSSLRADCELAAVAGRLAASSLMAPEDAAEAVCSGGLQQEWEALRALTGAAFADRRFAYWGVLIFGILERLRAHIRGHVDCLGGRRRSHCEPAAVAEPFLQQLRTALERGTATSAAAAASFLVQASPLCSAGLASAHFALAETLVMLMVRGEPPASRHGKPGALQSKLAGAWVVAEPFPVNELHDQEFGGPGTGDGADMRPDIYIDVELLSVLRRASGVVQFPAPAVSISRPRPRGNLSALGSGIIDEDVRWLLDEAWVITSGEPLEVLLAGEWPLTAFAARLFGRLAALSPWRPPPATRIARKQHRNTPHGAAGEQAASDIPESWRPDPASAGSAAPTVSNTFETTAADTSMIINATGALAVALAPSKACPSLGSSSYVGDVAPSRGCDDSSGVVATMAPAVDGVLDKIEAALEAAGHAELVDRLFATVSREGGARGASPTLRAATWLHDKHFEVGGLPRAGKDVERFRRRLELLLGSA